MISVQELVNNGLAFGASCSAGPEFLDRLERDGYFQLIEKIGSLMYADGYCGDVCVDSMILHEGELAPLVEINARKSMSLIKHAIDDYLKRLERKGCLTYVSAVNDQSSDFSGLLELLERERLLFSTECNSGILPLTVRHNVPQIIFRASGAGEGKTLCRRGIREARTASWSDGGLSVG